MIKKFILSSISAVFLFVLMSAVFVTPIFAAECGAFNSGTRGVCGAAANCPANYVCSQTGVWTWECLDGTAATGNGRCENIDQTTRNTICGITYNSNRWCGASGGCAAGYICDKSSLSCVQNVACENIQNGHQIQCGKSGSETIGQCGSAGKCAEGYRCTTHPYSLTGYACLPQKDENGNACPGAPNQPEAEDPLFCGQTTTNPADPCGCTSTSPDGKVDKLISQGYCCGIAAGDTCFESQEAFDASRPTPTPHVVTPPKTTPPVVIPEDGGSTGGTGGGGLNIFEGPTSEDFAELNPLEKFGDSAINSQYFTSPAGIISRVLLFAFPIAGLILFLMLVWAGFQILSGAFNGGSKSIDAGKQRATTALVGFILLFVAYWVMQIIEVIFGITIL